MLTRFWHVLFQGRSCSKRLACKPGVGGRGGGGGGGGGGRTQNFWWKYAARSSKP